MKTKETPGTSLMFLLILMSTFVPVFAKTSTPITSYAVQITRTHLRRLVPFYLGVAGPESFTERDSAVAVRTDAMERLRVFGENTAASFICWTL